MINPAFWRHLSDLVIQCVTSGSALDNKITQRLQKIRIYGISFRNPYKTKSAPNISVAGNFKHEDAVSYVKDRRRDECCLIYEVIAKFICGTSTGEKQITFAITSCDLTYMNWGISIASDVDIGGI